VTVAELANTATKRLDHAAKRPAARASSGDRAFDMAVLHLLPRGVPND
jgi:hypothetical protein